MHNKVFLLCIHSIKKQNWQGNLSEWYGSLKDDFRSGLLAFARESSSLPLQSAIA